MGGGQYQTQVVGIEMKTHIPEVVVNVAQTVDFPCLRHEVVIDTFVLHSMSCSVYS